MKLSLASIKLPFLLALGLLAALFLASCNNDDDGGGAPADFSPEALHGGSSKSWRLAEIHYADTIDGEGTNVEVVDDSCDMDDEWIYREDGTFEVALGPVECPDSVLSFEPRSGAYVYNESERTLTQSGVDEDGEAFSDQLQVAELTEDRLHLVLDTTMAPAVFFRGFVFTKK